MIKIRKISTVTGLGLSKWIVFENKSKAVEYINSNQSASGTFYWISKTI